MSKGNILPLIDFILLLLIINTRDKQDDMTNVEK